jgi:uncharacterized protein (TIGR02300 family)
MVAKLKTDPRGLKRICTNCGTRFYDMSKRPINCPSCETEFTGDIKVKSRRGRAAANDPAESQVIDKSVMDDEDDVVAGDGDDELVSLDEVEALEGDDEDEADLAIDDDLGDLDDLDAELEDEVEDIEEE